MANLAKTIFNTKEQIPINIKSDSNQSMLKKLLRSILWFPREYSRFAIKAILCGRSLKIIQNNLCNITKKEIVAFSTIQNEAYRIEFFLEYYRKLGVGHFIFVDNDSTDGLLDMVSQHHDVSVYHTKGSYERSGFGIHWLNHLRNKHGMNRWCLTCDLDEFIVYPYMEQRDLIDLTQYLDSICECSFFTLMIDMYSRKKIADSKYIAGTDPLETFNYFDGYGYSKKFMRRYLNYFVQGGVRQRVFFKDTPVSAPALNKIPLVKWFRGCAYVSSTHIAIPRRLNNKLNISKTTGALLQFKFTDCLIDKVKHKVKQNQRFNWLVEYNQYKKVIESEINLYESNISTKYTGWRQLSELGLINIGEWS